MTFSTQFNGSGRGRLLLVAFAVMATTALVGCVAAGAWSAWHLEPVERWRHRVGPIIRPDTRGPGGTPDWAALPTADLGRLWVRTRAQVLAAHDPAELGALTALRGACLEELERRDPDGCARWLTVDPRAAGHDPSPYLHGGSRPKAGEPTASGAWENVGSDRAGQRLESETGAGDEEPQARSEE